LRDRIGGHESRLQRAKDFPTGVNLQAGENRGRRIKDPVEIKARPKPFANQPGRPFSGGGSPLEHRRISLDLQQR
jgi:hypothetical protein